MDAFVFKEVLDGHKVHAHVSHLLDEGLLSSEEEVVNALLIRISSK